MDLYVVYSFTKDNAHGYGCTTYRIRGNKITLNDIVELADQIKRENKYDSVLIINWKELGW